MKKALLCMMVIGLSTIMMFGCSKDRKQEENKTKEEKMSSTDQQKNNPIVVIKTTKGTIKLTLNREKAPLSVANFLEYVNNDHYKDTIFHRVIDGFMIQGGGFTKDMKQKAVKAPIKNEAANGLKNTRGTIAMARTSDINSATSQFFINVADNGFLDHKGETPRDFGYCVFGEVTEGMDVVDKIKATKTANSGVHQNVPVEPVEIIEVSVVK